MPDVQNISLPKIVKRLELIISLISLEEEDEINAHVAKLEQFDANEELEIIIVYLKYKSYDKAVTAIDAFINKHYKLISDSDPQNDSVNQSTIMSQHQLIPYRKKDKWGFCTSDRKIVVDCMYEDADVFFEGLARVKMNGKLGFINERGIMIIPCSFDEIFFLDRLKSKAYSFSDELVLVKTNGKYGFINKEGVISIPCSFDNAYSFSEGLASIETNGKRGYIDKTGTIVIPCSFDDALPFSEGLAIVEFCGQEGFINRAGKVVIPFSFNIASPFLEGLAVVYLGEKCREIAFKNLAIKVRWSTFEA